jgi:hypothetical protein
MTFGIADMFGKIGGPSTAAPDPSAFSPELGSILERMLLAQMPMGSSWALRAGSFPRGYGIGDYDLAVHGMEPVGYNPGSPQVPFNPVDMRSLLVPPANVNRISVVR